VLPELLYDTIQYSKDTS